MEINFKLHHYDDKVAAFTIGPFKTISTSLLYFNTKIKVIHQIFFFSVMNYNYF